MVLNWLIITFGIAGASVVGGLLLAKLLLRDSATPSKSTTMGNYFDRPERIDELGPIDFPPNNSTGLVEAIERSLREEPGEWNQNPKGSLSRAPLNGLNGEWFKNGTRFPTVYCGGRCGMGWARPKDGGSPFRVGVAPTSWRERRRLRKAVIKWQRNQVVRLLEKVKVAE